MSDLGRLTNRNAKRDAVHVATAPAVCCEELLQPGERIGVDPWYNTMAEKRHNPCGVVDPFLKEPVLRGQWFNILIDPGTVKNLRHQWDHELFINEDVADGDDECRGC